MKTSSSISTQKNPAKNNWHSNFFRIPNLIFLLAILSSAANAQTFNWAGNMGSSASDEGRSIVVDANGNVYSTGLFRTTCDFDPGLGTNSLVSLGLEDVYIMKQDAAGALVWVQGIGGAGSDIGYGIALDATGAVIVTGRFASAVDFDPGVGISTLTSNGLGDIFILKLNSAGGYVWAKQIGGTGDDIGRSVVVDQSNNIFTTGYFTGTVDFDPGAGVVNLICPGSSQNAFVSKLDASGNHVFSRRLGGTSGAYGLDIALDASGNIFATGYFAGTGDFDPDAIATANLTSAGQQDVFTTKLNSSGNYSWANRIGAGFADVANSIAIAANGDVVITGYFQSTVDFNPGSGTYSRSAVGGDDIFVVKLDNAGVFDWGGVMGSNADDQGLTVAIDAADDIYIGGYYGNLCDFDPTTINNSSNCYSNEDLFICQLSTYGNFRSLFHVGQLAGLGSNKCYAITTRSCKIYSTGFFEGGPVDFDPGVSTYDLSATARDIYVHQMSTIRSSTQSTSICATSYTWPTNSTTYTSSGTYIAYLTTAGGCDSIRTLTLTLRTIPTVSTTTSNATICQGNTTTITASGASTYAWLPGSLSGTTVAVSPITTTTYTVTGTAANGCTAISTQMINVNSSPTVTTTASISTICAGSSTSLSASGASTYTWMPGSLSGTSVTVSPTTTTTYTITGTAVNGCTNTSTLTIVVNAAPTVTSTASNSTICLGSTTTLTSSGAVTYAWMPGSLSGTSVSVSPTTTTTYTVTGTAASGCTNTSTIAITVNPTPTITATASSTSLCVGNSATMTASGANTYAWMPGSLSGSSITITPSSTTTYSVTGTDINGCTSQQTITITVGSVPTVTASTSTPNICTGSSATLVGTGTTTYSWMPGSLSGSSVTVTPTSTTTYTVTGTNGPGCFNTATITVIVNPLPTVSSTSSASVICEGNPSTLTASGASTYAWMPGSLSGTVVTVSPTAATTYTLTGTDANGCTATSTSTITVNPTPTITVTASTDTICEGNVVTLSAGGASSYTWMPGSLTGNIVSVTPVTNTTYTVTGLDANGCSNSNSTTIVVNVNPTVTITASNNTICSGDSTVLTASGSGTTFNWTPGPANGNVITVTPTANTTYVLLVSDALGCTVTDSISIIVNASPVLTTSVSNTSICIGDTATLTVVGANTYYWMPGSMSGGTISVSPTSTTTYTVVGTASNGCTHQNTITIAVGTSPTVTLTANASTICEGSSTYIAASGTATYSWMPGSLTGSGVTVTPMSTTTYTVIGMNSPSCTDTSLITITVNPTPVVTFTLPIDTVCLNDGAFTLNGGSPAGGTYSGPGVTSNQFNPSATGVGNYTITYSYSDAFGCADSASQQLIVDPCTGLPALNEIGTLSVAPNPNNGEFVLSFSTVQSDNYVLEIHNSLGQVVFTENINDFAGDYRRDISLTNFGAGIYTVRLTNSTSQTIFRVITQ